LQAAETVSRVCVAVLAETYVFYDSQMVKKPRCVAVPA